MNSGGTVYRRIAVYRNMLAPLKQLSRFLRFRFHSSNINAGISGFISNVIMACTITTFIRNAALFDDRVSLIISIFVAAASEIVSCELWDGGGVCSSHG